MHVAIQVDDPVLTEAFKSYIERRLRFALGRFGGRVSQIAVRVGADGHSADHSALLPAPRRDHA